MDKVLKLIFELKAELATSNENFGEKFKLDDLIDDDRMVIPEGTEKIFDSFLLKLTTILKNGDITIDSEIEEEREFWKFISSYAMNRIDMSEKTKILQEPSEESSKCIKYVFDNHIVLDNGNDYDFNDIDKEVLENVGRVINGIVNLQINRNFSHDVFLRQISSDFEISEANANYIYELINANKEILVQKHLFLILRKLASDVEDINEEIKLIKHQIKK